ncbi:hypothetical protein J6590_056366 [Homalodisca vitripennis]|nr:hypothetical protein J6590_056366 [Homalodisca vitripennis]
MESRQATEQGKLAAVGSDDHVIGAHLWPAPPTWRVLDWRQTVAHLCYLTSVVSVADEEETIVCRKRRRRSTTPDYISEDFDPSQTGGEQEEKEVTSEKEEEYDPENPELNPGSSLSKKRKTSHVAIILLQEDGKKRKAPQRHNETIIPVYISDRFLSGHLHLISDHSWSTISLIAQQKKKFMSWNSEFNNVDEGPIHNSNHVEEDSQFCFHAAHAGVSFNHAHYTFRCAPFRGLVRRRHSVRKTYKLESLQHSKECERCPWELVEPGLTRPCCCYDTNVHDVS